MVVAMERNSQVIKTKPLPSEDSEEEEEEEETSDEDETEDEEEAEELSAFESESDESTDASKKKTPGIVNGKQQAGAKAAVVPASPAKRSRETNGKKEKDDEPSSKKKKPEVVTAAPKTATPRPVAPSKVDKVQPQDKKKENATKPEKTKPETVTKADKEKLQKESTSDKETKKSQKKKSQSPGVPTKADTPKPSTSVKSEGDQDKATPQKPKKPAQQWTPDEETTLSKELQKDRVLGVYGSVIPSSRSDAYWEKLLRRLPFMEKYEKDQRIERLCEKVRRMRLRYEVLLMRIQADETNIWKNKNEEGIWRIWHTIWGPNKATMATIQADEDDDEDEDDDDDEEDDDKNKQTKQPETLVTEVGSQKKEASSKKSESGSEDEESDKEESPVKPVSLHVGIAAANPLIVKSVPGPGPSPMQVDLNTPGKEILQAIPVHDHGTQVGEPGPVAVAGQLARGGDLPMATSSGELGTESREFLRDVRSTCLKMVDEARTQSLLILEEARAKTIQMVDEARGKSSQIMEELRVVAERLGALSGQGGRQVGSSLGGWNDFGDGLLPGRSLFGVNGMTLGDQSQIQDQWREQTEAEQGLLLQRLQLVQEQARIQQEGIRLKISFQKQQAEARAEA